MLPTKTKPKCSYCGRTADEAGGKLQLEHVFADELYPPSKNNSKVQRLTILSCGPCNHGVSDDEAHFRQILAVAGEPNPARQEIWNTVLRSFNKIDGPHRLRDLRAAMEPIITSEGERYMVFPGQHERVLRVVRKIIRGLCHYHGIESAVADERVVVELLKYPAPPEVLESMTYDHREPDVAEYWYCIWDDDGDESVRSTFILNFYQRVPFIGWVSKK